MRSIDAALDGLDIEIRINDAMLDGMNYIELDDTWKAKATTTSPILETLSPKRM